ncbi:MAG: CdaR family protein [Myxococcota bacterium]
MNYKSILFPFYHNWLLKLMALVIALALFIVVRNDKDTEGIINVKVKYINKPDDKILMNNPIHKIKLMVRGPWAQIKKLDGTIMDKNLIVDMGAIKNSRFYLDHTLFELPEEIRISNISPQYLPINLETKLRRTVPLNIQVKSSRFLEVSEVKLDPDKIIISGPKSLVLSFPQLSLPPLKIKEDGVFEKKIDLPELPPKIKIKSNIKQITVKIVAEKSKTTKNFNDIPIRMENPSTDFTLVPEHVKITVDGYQSKLYSFSPSQLKPYVEIPEQPKKQVQLLPVRLKSVKGLSFQISPEKVKVINNTIKSEKKP